jgi:predicted Zn-dependent protease
MAKAGYDPREAIPFWQRMSSGKQGQGPPEFLSTHPSGKTRIAQLRQWMPEALQYYHGR